jgi:hypothetical protein
MSEMNAPAAQNENKNIKLSAFGEAIQTENARLEMQMPTTLADKTEETEETEGKIIIAFDDYDAKYFLLALMEGIEGVGERAQRGEIFNPSQTIHFLCDAAKQVLQQI